MTIFGDPLLAELLSLANVAFAFILAFLSIGRARNETGFLRVLLILSGLIGLYWGGIYLFVFFTPSGSVNPVSFGQIFIRPVFTLTLAMMASMAVYRWRVGK